jgi:hypothetical protein
LGCQTLARDIDESTLRVFLSKLSAMEIIDSLIGILHSMYDTDESFHGITMRIVTIVQVLEIQRDGADLRTYEEDRQKQLFQELLKDQTKCEWKRDLTFDVAFKDWKDSGLTFNQWVNDVKPQPMG